MIPIVVAIPVEKFSGSPRSERRTLFGVAEMPNTIRILWNHLAPVPIGIAATVEIDVPSYLGTVELPSKKYMLLFAMTISTCADVERTPDPLVIRVKFPEPVYL